VYFLRFAALPKEGSDDYGESGGAYVNCWINTEDEEEAERFARQFLSESGWTIEVRDDSHPSSLEDALQSDHDLQYYQEAEEHGSSFVFHKWPFGSIEEG